jgi:hypothetical protein
MKPLIRQAARFWGCWKCWRWSRTRGSGGAAGSRWCVHPRGRGGMRALWGTDGGDLDFPRVSRVARIRRDRYDITGALISKEVVHAVTSLDAGQATAADLAAIARGQ